MMNFLRFACFVYLLLLPLVPTTQAQVLFVGSEQRLHISGEGLLTVQGSLDNRGQIFNEGEMNVQGDWLNRGQYMASSSGRVDFSSSQTQTIDHWGQNFNHLIISGGGEKLLLADVRVISELTLTQGIVKAQNNASVLFSEDAIVSASGTNAYVQAAMVHRGTGYKFFPMGDEDSYQPLELMDVQGSSPVLQAQVFTPNTAPRVGEKLEVVSPVRYWQLSTLSGTYEGSVIGLGIGNDPTFDDLLGVVVAAAPEVSGEFTNLGAAGPSNTIGIESVTSELSTLLPIIALGRTTEFAVEGEVLVPNAFAPDAPDPRNRSLYIFARNLLPDGFVFRIFDRWGMLVYETTSTEEALTSGWNGIHTSTNEPAQFGVYSYYLSGRFAGNQRVEKKGTITLFR